MHICGGYSFKIENSDGFVHVYSIVVPGYERVIR